MEQDRFIHPLATVQSHQHPPCITGTHGCSTPPSSSSPSSSPSSSCLANPQRPRFCARPSLVTEQAIIAQAMHRDSKPVDGRLITTSSIPSSGWVAATESAPMMALHGLLHLKELHNNNSPPSPLQQQPKRRFRMQALHHHHHHHHHHHRRRRPGLFPLPSGV